ncbi:MAG: J domain-containing protein, partial [Hyphomicrobium sp.]
VGAIGKRAVVRSWIEGDRLNVELPAGNAPAAQQACFEGPSRLGVGAGHGRRSVIVANTCLPRRGKASFDHMVLPVGYAPVGELGARLVSAAPAGDHSDVVAGTAGTPGEPSLIPVAAASDEAALAKAYPDPSWKPLLDPVTREARLVPTGSGSEWVTVVRSGDDAMAEAGAGGTLGAGSLVWLLVAMMIATVTVIVRVRTSPASAVRAAAISPNLPVLLARLGLIDLGAGRFDGEVHRNLTGAGLAVAAILDQAETEVAQLKDAGPLREVLLSEIALVEQRLANVDAAAAEGQERGAKSVPQFRVLVRDLERIRRIAESAAASFSGTREATILPKTTSEAYAILGVNPDVSESVLKKIVDALRMSWHPDHARDEADRRVREDRIDQHRVRYHQPKSRVGVNSPDSVGIWISESLVFVVSGAGSCAVSPSASNCGATSAGSLTVRERPSKQAPCSIDRLRL